jgi:glucosamine--fructose-6-phosphate aminotransferase (isomerizing)
MTTIFEEEIRSQGGILRERASLGMAQADEVGASWKSIKYALVAARGSSDNAARFFQYLAGQELGLLVALATPSLYESDKTIGLSDAGVLAISQSGRSPGMAEVLQQARRQGCPNATITNDVASHLAQISDHVINLAAGPERAIAATKTFSSTWHALAQLVSALKGTPLDGLDELPGLVDEVADWALTTSLPISLLDVENGLTVVGRGVGAAVAAEISLKVREVTGIRSEAYSAADYLHGPIGADGEGSTLLLAITEEMTDDLSAGLLDECRQFGMKTVVLRPPERNPMKCDGEIVLTEPMANWSAGLAEVIVGQALALRLGELRGRPIDTAPGLSKVTLTA